MKKIFTLLSVSGLVLGAIAIATEININKPSLQGQVSTKQFVLKAKKLSLPIHKVKNTIDTKQITTGSLIVE